MVSSKSGNNDKRGTTTTTGHILEQHTLIILDHQQLPFT
jgi:hypothetical protein